MINLIKASLFKLFRDRTFHVTAIIGVVLAFLMIGICYLTQSLNGQSLLMKSIIPGNNFGLTIPINLIVFTVGEFTYGTIRNKVIAGLSRTKIFLGLFITGLVFTFMLLVGYSILTVGFGSIFGGFSAEAIGGVKFILLFVVYVVCSYIFITAVSIFFSVLMRSIGGSNSIVIILLVFLSMLPLIIYVSDASNLSTPDHWSMWLNPLYFPGFYGNDVVSLLNSIGGSAFLGLFNQTPEMIAAGIVTPIAWSIIFIVGGLIVFKHSDIK